MTGESLDIHQNQIDKLKQLFPETITEGKIDWEKLQASLGKENIEFSNERYVLNWAGKSEAFKVLQQSTTATLKPVPDESINFDTTENVFIEGENLEVLKVLQKSYYNKIKCIIIDPPYNTGNDSFIYPDSFKESKEDYQKRIGDIDEEGYLMKEGFFRNNSKDSGRYHSNWLSMMYPRLFLAKNLLSDDGVIFVHIDDNEVHNLRLMLNEILGEENFVAQIVWEKRYGRSNDVKFFSSVTDYILLYRKTSSLTMLREPREESNNDIYSNPDNDQRGPWTSVSFVSQRTKEERKNLSYKIKNPNTGEENEHPINSWKYSFEKFEQLEKEKRFYWGKDGTQKFPRIKRFLSELPAGLVPVNLWKFQEVGTGEIGTREVDSLLGKEVFTYPKPTSLLKKMLKIGTESDSIIIDFFGGSGSTAQAVYELNNEDGGTRKIIIVQLPELCEETTEAFKVGYKTIAELSKDRLRKAISKIENKKFELLDENKKSEITLNDYKSELEKLKKNKPELNFEEISVSKDAKRLYKAIEKIELKIEQNIELINNTNVNDLGFKVFKLSPSNFKIWRGNDITVDNLETQLDAFTDPVREGSETENMLYELILKAGYLLTDKVEKQNLDVISTSLNEQVSLDDQTQTYNGNYYLVNDGELIIALDAMNQQLIDTIISAKPKKVITLDKLFEGNDQLKTNAVLQMRDADIDFKTI